MSCLSASAQPRPQTLNFTCALVCGTSLGTTQLLYADGTLLLDSDGKVFVMPKN